MFQFCEGNFAAVTYLNLSLNLVMLESVLLVLMEIQGLAFVITVAETFWALDDAVNPLVALGGHCLWPNGGTRCLLLKYC